MFTLGIHEFRVFVTVFRLNHIDCDLCILVDGTIAELEGTWLNLRGDM